ncbi:MAG: ATP-binding cassette domain-containing protein [Saprospiraceae bacterium]|nr:ATP-binding cassette domain-containing protein [Saprospiraceae bacterium]
MNHLLELDKVYKEYSNLIAVNNISLKVPSSCIFGLLGPNGAGKTSLIRIITGITKPDKGTVRFHNSYSNTNTSSLIGYMPEERGLYKKMTVGEQLIYLCRLKGLSKQDSLQSVNYWLDKFEIQSWWNKKVEELSKGMSQKVQFIATVAHKPKLIILDEPFSGLDPINTNLIKDEIIQLKNDGASILFSTHRMEQVEELCEEIVLVNKGKNVLSGHVKDIRQSHRENLFIIETIDTISSFEDLDINVVKQENHNITIRLKDNQSSNQVLTNFIKSGHQILSFNEVLPTFNDIFIKTVNEFSHE